MHLGSFNPTKEVAMATMRQHERVIVGNFSTAAEARRAIRDLRDANFRDDKIGVLTQDRDGDPDVRWFKDLEGNNAGRGAVAGVVAGAGGGALWAAGIAMGVLPAIGPIIGGGILAAYAASAALGAGAGMLVGALIGLGISDDEAAYYEQEFHRGRTILVVEPGARAELAQTILRGHGSLGRQVVTPATLAEQVVSQAR